MGCLGKYSVKNSEAKQLTEIYRKQPLLDYSAVVSDEGTIEPPPIPTVHAHGRTSASAARAPCALSENSLRARAHGSAHGPYST